MPRGFPCKTTQQHMDRFWSFVDLFFGITDEDCWNWTGAVSTNGYALFSVKSKMIRAHRFLYQYLKQITLTSHELLCHHCDNRICVNPSHVYVGSYKDNNRDTIQRAKVQRCPLNGTLHTPGHLPKQKRVLCGEQISRFSRQQIHCIRNLAPAGISQTKLGKWFGMSRANISAIVRGKSWTHKPNDLAAALKRADDYLKL